MKKIFIASYCFILLSLSALTQNDRTILHDLLKEDKRTIEALVLYPDSTRRIILEGAGQPDALARIKNIQEKTQERFRLVIDSLSQDVQITFYELARYPKLIEALASTEKKSKTEIKALLEDYPQEIHEQALKLGRKRYRELSEIYQLQREAEQAFDAVVQDYPPSARDNLQHLINMPEVLDIMMNNFRSTVIMGSEYKRNPEGVMHFADSIQMEVAQRHAEELADWKANLEKDPAALEELEAAAEEFAEENGYDSRDYRSDLTEKDLYLRSHVWYAPYSYWFGYPYWYSYPMWYPRPYWYYWGYYYDLNHRVVIVDFPSWYFVNWYFGRRYHHALYPRLTNQYLTHYERHRSSTLSTTSRIRDWAAENQNTYSRNWLRSDDRRVDRLREYGTRDLSNRTRQVPVYRRPVYNPASTPSTRSQPERIDRRRTLINRAPEYHREVQRKINTGKVVRPQIPSKPQVIPQVRKRNVPKRKNN